MDTLLHFWGKTPKHGEPADRYHPAIFHMLDVACVAEALLRDGAPRLRQALLHAWDGCDADALLAWLPFLIATHDLGKISAAFQGQAKHDATRLQRERLETHGIRFGAIQDLYHAEISALWLHDHLAQREPGISDYLIWALRDAMGGHHGRFAQESLRRIRQRQLASERGEPRWDKWRNEAYNILRDALAPTRNLTALGAPRALRPATIALTGFIVWCDWMGSNERDFPATQGLTVAQYTSEAGRRAQAALITHGLRAARSAPVYGGVRMLFPDMTQPRPLQTLIDELPAGDLDRPLLAVIEAPTGEGKTEAALVLARRIAAARGIDEIFFALPTMATGNQMFVRLETFFRHQYGDAGAVRLTHSQSMVVEDDLRHRVALATDGDVADAESASAISALAWFAGPKKAMLAPFGVGTVDQVELAGLNVRHYPLRLFGLAGKVIVIDEIHAYDSYMSAILAHTLTWLASLGCSVILLSATLPTSRHHALASAFLAGLPGAPSPQPPSTPHYPALALYGAVAHRQLTCAVFRGEQRFNLRMAAERDAAAEAAYLLKLVRDGGAVARLCNRVDDAQALYKELLGLLPSDCRVLLHARFPLRERQAREQRVTDLLGKQTTRRPDEPLIIVGTQVLEQSLDYDVDVMVSDFAPIDLLLQRAGRLHRHARQRPARHTAPVLEVTLPGGPSGRPQWDRWASIYDPYMLWRTWETLRATMRGDACEISLPRDYRPLIEAVYAETLEDDPGATYAAEIAAARARYIRVRDEQESQARRPLTPSARRPDAITEASARAFIADDEGQAANWQLAKTRLGDRITVAPVFRVDGNLCLDATGTFRLSPDVAPDLDWQKLIIAHAVPISDRRIIAAYRDDRRPRTLQWPWTDVPPLLRSIAPLPLDRAQTARFDDRIVRLDPDLGLVIERDRPTTGWQIEEDL